MIKLLLITPGDPEGVGPEICWKAFRADSVKLFKKKTFLIFVGARAPFKRLKAPVLEIQEAELKNRSQLAHKLSKNKTALPLLCAPTLSHEFLSGFQAGWSIEKATRLVLGGFADAIVTGPISKERLQRGGFHYPGHTEFLADICKAPSVTMMLANDQLRVSLVTTHLALKDVPSAITRDNIGRAVLHTTQALKHWWGVRKPKIAVAALNPHAGENGLFGKEEIETITPAIEFLQMQAKGKFEIQGPLPADTLFAQHVLRPKNKRFDAVVCLYHDQGLIPVKLLDFHKTVNVSLGLPIVRTSVDHGVGFDIAWKGKANPSSLRSAIALAFELTQKRK